MTRCEEIGRLIGDMIAKADLFCSKIPTVLREPEVEYITTIGNMSEMYPQLRSLDVPPVKMDELDEFFNLQDQWSH